MSETVHDDEVLDSPPEWEGTQDTDATEDPLEATEGPTDGRT